MADAKKGEENGAPAAAPKKKKLLLFIIIGLLVVAIGGGGAFYVLKKKKHAEDGDEEPAKEETKKAKSSKENVPPVFIKLDPFTVKLQSENQESYLQATPELRVADAKVGEQVKLYMPEIRHKVLLILSGKKSDDLSSPQGVERLSNEMRVTINEVLDPTTAAKRKLKAAKTPAKETKEGEAPAAVDLPEPTPDDPIQSVLFTSFIVQ